MQYVFLLLPLLASLLGLAAALFITRNKLAYDVSEFDDFELLQYIARELHMSEYSIIESAYQENGRTHENHIYLAFKNYLMTTTVPDFVRAHALDLLEKGHSREQLAA